MVVGKRTLPGPRVATQMATQVATQMTSFTQWRPQETHLASLISFTKVWPLFWSFLPSKKCMPWEQILWVWKVHFGMVLKVVEAWTPKLPNRLWQWLTKVPWNLPTGSNKNEQDWTRMNTKKQEWTWKIKSKNIIKLCHLLKSFWSECEIEWMWSFITLSIPN